MTTKIEQYRAAQDAVPETTLAWNMYGVGVENIGRNNAPESFPTPQPNADQMLVRVDSVGMCFSDVKLIKQGGSHPKLYNRDLAVEPGRLGHEVAVTVVDVGENLQDRYQAGQRLAVQPDIYQNGKSTAYGYTIPGGLVQYHVMGEEMLVTDAGLLASGAIAPVLAALQASPVAVTLYSDVQADPPEQVVLEAAGLARRQFGEIRRRHGFQGLSQGEGALGPG